MHRLLALLVSATATMSAFATESGGPESAPIVPPTPASPGAPGPGGPGHPAQTPDYTFILIMLAGLAFFWFILIRPQRKEDKRRQALVASMKPGHQVVTIGGLHAEVVAVGETTVDLKVGQGDQGMVMKFNKTAVATNLTAAESK